MMVWARTIKFKIAALAVATGVLSALVTAEFVLGTTRASIENLLLDNGAGARQSAAALLSNKLELLEITISSIARALPPAYWSDPALLTRFLLDKPAANALFDTVIAIDTRGQVVVRLQRGLETSSRPDVSDRPYFQDAIKTDQVVVSEPIVGRVNNEPQVILAIAAPTLDGRPTGVIAGSLALNSTSLLQGLAQGDVRDGSRSIVINRSGKILAHPEPSRVMGDAQDEPGFASTYLAWRDSGAPIDTDGSAALSGDYLVSMAGIALSDWMLVQLTPKAVALKPLRAAQRTAWISAFGVGLAAAVIAGFLALRMTRPITRLRDRAMASLTEKSASLAKWPDWHGELGELARVFQHVENERAQRQDVTDALLLQIEAVLDHADIGIALTRDGKFELVSRHFCDTFGMTKQDMEGQSTRAIYDSDEAFAALAARARPQFMEQGYFAGEVELRRKSGQIFWAFMRGRAVVAGDLSKGTIWTFEDVTDSRAQREKLTWTSSHDALTGLCNRAAFEAVLTDATAEAAVVPFCALFLDLDHFKQVNDTAGHAAGDAVLRDIATILLAQVRKADTVSRLGGDEFAIVLSACPLQQGRTVAEKIRAAIVAYQLDWEGSSFQVGASIGLVLVDAGFTGTTEVLAAADNACYAAKHRGRNCVMVYGD